MKSKRLNVQIYFDISCEIKTEIETSLYVFCDFFAYIQIRTIRNIYHFITPNSFLFCSLILFENVKAKVTFFFKVKYNSPQNKYKKLNKISQNLSLNRNIRSEAKKEVAYADDLSIVLLVLPQHHNRGVLLYSLLRLTASQWRLLSSHGFPPAVCDVASLQK